AREHGEDHRRHRSQRGRLTAMGLEALRKRLRAEGVLSMAALIEAVAGEPVRGSWWGHPKGRLIFQIASALEDDGEVLTAKLVGGKVTFIDRALFGPLYRIVSDRRWRKAAIAGLPADARALLDDVPARGSISIEAVAASRG